MSDSFTVKLIYLIISIIIIDSHDAYFVVTNLICFNIRL